MRVGDNWAYLPHEIIEGDYRSCDVEWRVERIRKVIQEGIRRAWVKNGWALLVA